MMMTTANIRQNMVSKDNKDGEALSSIPSQWDKLPNELKDMVLNCASPLTLFLNGRLKLDPNGDKETIHSLWIEAFDTDWKGDLDLLPENDGHILFPSLKNADLARVKSRSMYERLCRRFPEATEANTEFADTDKQIELFCETDNPTDSQKRDPCLDDPLRLLHIPMRHLWLDILGDTLDTYPNARVKDCIVEGHCDLLRHLVDTGKVDLSCIKVVQKKTFNEFAFYHALDVAAERGHLDILEILHKTGCQEATTSAMDHAARYGHLDIVKWLHVNRTEGCTTKAFYYAGMAGHPEIVDWLHQNHTQR